MPDSPTSSFSATENAAGAGQTPGIGPQRQRDIYLAGVAGSAPVIPTEFGKLAELARRHISAEAWAYIAGGAGRGQTMANNEAAFARQQILPGMLRDVGLREGSVTVLGQRWASPFFACPIGVLEMVHPDGDRAVARAAAACGVPLLISNQASAPMEAVSAASSAANPDALRWFQLYWSRSNELVESFVQRAESCGCQAIVVTLDTTLLGWRTADLNLAWLPFLRGMGIAQYTSDPVFQRLLAQNAFADDNPPPRKVNASSLAVLMAQLRRHPGSWWANLRSGEATRAVQLFTRIYSRPTLEWSDLRFLRDRTRLPILLKGIQHPDDARKAQDHGVDGLIVSNHGGRQVDGAIAALDALPGVLEAVRGRMPVLLDSGLRSGADAFKALAIGADAVGIGRPFAYALALAGQAGVEALFRNFQAEFDLTMGLSGCRNRQEINAAMLQGYKP